MPNCRLKYTLARLFDPNQSVITNYAVSKTNQTRILGPLVARELIFKDPHFENKLLLIAHSNGQCMKILVKHLVEKNVGGQLGYHDMYSSKWIKI
jgi:hypothetical protein